MLLNSDDSITGALCKHAILIQMQPGNCEDGDGGLEGSDLMLPLFFVCRTCVRDHADALHPHMDGSAQAQLCELRVLGLI